MGSDLSSSGRAEARRSTSAISRGGLLSVMDHPKRAQYGRQKMLVVRIRDYADLVPYVESEKEIFWKSIMPNRKATQDFISGDK